MIPDLSVEDMKAAAGLLARSGQTVDVPK